MYATRASSESDARVSRETGTSQERVDNFNQRHIETCSLDQQNKIAFPNHKDIIITQALEDFETYLHSR